MNLLAPCLLSDRMTQKIPATRPTPFVCSHPSARRTFDLPPSMHRNAITLHFPTARLAAHGRHRSSPHPARSVSTSHRYRRPMTPEGGTLELSRACTRVSAITGQWESYSILFLGACALAVVTGCLFHMERFVAHWDSFESFVRALVA